MSIDHDPPAPSPEQPPRVIQQPATELGMRVVSEALPSVEQMPVTTPRASETQTPQGISRRTLLFGGAAAAVGLVGTGVGIGSLFASKNGEAIPTTKPTTKESVTATHAPEAPADTDPTSLENWWKLTPDERLNVIMLPKDLLEDPNKLALERLRLESLIFSSGGNKEEMDAWVKANQGRFGTDSVGLWCQYIYDTYYKPLLTKLNGWVPEKRATDGWAKDAYIAAASLSVFDRWYPAGTKDYEKYGMYRVSLLPNKVDLQLSTGSKMPTSEWARNNPNIPYNMTVNYRTVRMLNQDQLKIIDGLNLCPVFGSDIAKATDTTPTPHSTEYLGLHFDSTSGTIRYSDCNVIE